MTDFSSNTKQQLEILTRLSNEVLHEECMEVYKNGDSRIKVTYKLPRIKSWLERDGKLVMVEFMED